MGVPKGKTSKANKRSRHSEWRKMETPGLVECPQCHELKLQHRACLNCGYYKAKKVM